jgi:O-antigen/teichoic acid export membrane protein
LKWFRFRDEFIKQTGLVFIGMGLFNLFNLLYHLFMIRTLPPTDYGHLNTLIALFAVVSVPAGTVQTTITRFFSFFKAENKHRQAIELLRHFLLLMSIIAFSFFLLITFASSPISSFLQISSPGSVILLGLSLAFSMVITVPWGGLQGLQEFGPLAFNYIVNGGLKFALGVLFVFLGWEVLGALGAVAISCFVTTLVSFLMLMSCMENGKELLRGGPNNEGIKSFSVSEAYRYFLPVGTILLCFTVLTNVDIILVKHFFPPIEAGYYSIAQMVGKIILFLPFPVATVMFPKLSSSGDQEEKKLSILRRSLTVAGILCGGAIVLSFLFPVLIIRILSGKFYAECISLVRFFCVNMTFFSLVLILLNYHLCTQKRGFLFPIIFLTIIEIGLIVFFHSTLIQVLMIVGFVAFCLFIINFYLAYHPYLKARINSGLFRQT